MIVFGNIRPATTPVDPEKLAKVIEQIGQHYPCPECGKPTYYTREPFTPCERCKP